MTNWTWHQWQEAALFLAATVAVLGALLGLVIRLGRSHIDQRVDAKMKERDKGLDKRVTAAVKSAIAPLERQINNGLTTTVATIDARTTEQGKQLAEMHGWMKAAHPWNGNDRRSE